MKNTVSSSTTSTAQIQSNLKDNETKILLNQRKRILIKNNILSLIKLKKFDEINDIDLTDLDTLNGLFYWEDVSELKKFIKPIII